MKKWSKRFLSALCVAALLLGLMVPMGALAATPEHTLWIVGDSTVCSFNDPYYYPRYGYGTQIENYLDGTYKVENLALSGRSSRDFLTDTTGKVNYAKLFDAATGIKAGDALIIGFGHNDEKDGNTYTNPNGDWQTEGSFAKSLWDNYVKPAQDKGAEAILCTPIVRRTTGSTFSSSQLHITADKVSSGTTWQGGDYPAAIRKLGTDKNVPVVDLTELTKALYTQLTPAETLYLHAWTGSKEASVDNTHLNLYGAKVVARTLASALKDGNTELGKHVVLGDAPAKSELVPNPDYKEPEYTGDLPQSELWEDYNVYTVSGDVALTFKGTVFGDMGGANNISKDFETLETDEQGNMRIAVTGNKGKIASGADGIAMYYTKVPAGKLFTLKATATINSVGEGNTDLINQAAFGLMARDDMYIDTYDSAINADYVAAGSWANSSGSCASYYRKGGKLGGRGPMEGDSIEVGKSYDLSIVYNGDGFACTFGKAATQTGGFDFQLTSVDPDNVFVGMYVARCADVTFSNISLEIIDTPDEPVGPGETTDAVAGGGLETLFAELPGVADADVTAVKYTGAMDGELTGDDLTYLVRDAALSGGKTGVRVDIPGLKAGKYTLTVTAGDKDYTAKDLEVQAHDRSGFAHYNYTEGVGAYNDDGTLKDNAIVLYVTDQNKNEVVLSSKDEYREMTVTGIGNILNSNNSKKNLFLLRAIALFDKKPLVVRFLGTVTAPEGVSEFKQGSSNGGMVYMLSGTNITLEGIGPDATIQGWGFSFGADKNDAKEGLAKNFEVRNLSFKEVPEDCVEVTGRDNGSSATLEVPVTHAWVHNCAFYRPSDIQNPAEADKKQGDGALDFKFGEYMTSSYNYFDSCHKTSLIGGDDKNLQYHVTWHHNYWKNVESRAPLARQADMHIYNNLYEGQTSYCMSLRANTYIFSEYNTFLGCKDPVKDEGSGGVCKSFSDVFTDCTGVNNAKIVAGKTDTVTSANKFANFDTNPDSYVAKGAYQLDAADRGEANIKAWNGAMKAAADMTTVPMTATQVEPPVDPADKDALNAAITAAEAAMDIYTVEDDTKVTDVTYPTKFVTKTVKATYQAAVDAAKAVAANAAATQEEVDKAVADLAAATAAFNKAIKTGTKDKPAKRPSSNRGDREDTTTETNKPASEQFTDVVKDEWYESGITYVVGKGLFKGVAEGVFAPQSNMTRAMLMTVLARLDGQNTDGGDTWYAKGMAWAMEKNISDGTMPESNVTREQMVTMLYRYAKVGETTGDLSAFTDGDTISDWAKDAMTWAVGQEILKGKDGQRLDPQGTATRAEVATILQRFVEKTGK